MSQYISTGNFSVQKTRHSDLVRVTNAIDDNRVEHPLFLSYYLSRSIFASKCIAGQEK